MKKLILTACVLACVTSVFAQGTINFFNRVAGTLVAPVYGPFAGDPAKAVTGNTPTGVPAGTADYTGAALLDGPNYQAELWGGPVGTAADALVAATGGSTAAFRTGTGAGYWVNPTEAAVVPGVVGGVAATLQVRVWDKTTGTSWANATTKGASALFTSQALASGIATPPNLIGLTSFNLTGVAIPEPSTFALAGLGAAALLIFRRRK
jgi:hypothetical protein